MKVWKFPVLVRSLQFSSFHERFSFLFAIQFLLRGLPHLLDYLPEAVSRRKLLPDPENEPDFYEISKLFPLPGDSSTDVREEAKAALAAQGIIIGPTFNSAAASLAIDPTLQQSAQFFPGSVLNGVLNFPLAASSFHSDIAAAAAVMNLQQSTTSPYSGIVPSLLAQHNSLYQTQARLNRSAEPNGALASRTEESAQLQDAEQRGQSFIDPQKSQPDQNERKRGAG